MNQVTKGFMENILNGLKYELKTAEDNIEYHEGCLSKAQAKRNRLLDEIKALEKDLND